MNEINRCNLFLFGYFTKKDFLLFVISPLLYVINEKILYSKFLTIQWKNNYPLIYSFYLGYIFFNGPILVYSFFNREKIPKEKSIKINFLKRVEKKRKNIDIYVFFCIIMLIDFLSTFISINFFNFHKYDIYYINLFSFEIFFF